MRESASKRKQKITEKEGTKKIEDGSQEDVEFWCERGDKMKMRRKIEIRSGRNKILKENKNGGKIFLEKE